MIFLGFHLLGKRLTVGDEFPNVSPIACDLFSITALHFVPHCMADISNLGQAKTREFDTWMKLWAPNIGVGYCKREHLQSTLKITRKHLSKNPTNNKEGRSSS